MAGEIQLNSTSFATESGGTVTLNASTDIKGCLNASGSAPIYACRAWVNFDGTGTVAIRDSGNVTSITDNGTGDYTVNFTTAMPDANYAATISCDPDTTGPAADVRVSFVNTFATSSLKIITTAMDPGGTSRKDFPTISVAIFR